MLSRSNRIPRSWFHLLGLALLVLPQIASAQSSLWGAGLNDFGQLADGTAGGRTTPAFSGPDVTAVATGSYHTLFIKSDGSLWAVGGNAKGQLGDGTTINRTSPVKVAVGVLSVAAAGTHSVFLKEDGSLWGMGSNDFKQIGTGGSSQYPWQTPPKKIAVAVARVSTGLRFTAFLQTDGSLWFMGDKYFGQSSSGGIAPTKLTDDVASLSAGFFHLLFVKNDGTLWAMGDGTYGQLGNGRTSLVSAPVQIAANVTSASAGGLYSLFVTRDEKLWGTGYNAYGQFGTGDTTSSQVPVFIRAGVSSAYAGYYHSLFIEPDRSLWTVGYNTYGQLGDGTTTARSAPVKIATEVASACVGEVHTLFIKRFTSIDAQPRSQTITDGGRATFTVSTVGPSPLSFQWFRGLRGDESAPFAGATAPTFTTDPLSNTTSVWVKVICAGGNLLSEAASALVLRPPAITGQPKDQTVTIGRNAALQVEATGEVLSYQWYEGTAGDTSKPVAGATSSLLVTLPLKASASFWVRVSNALAEADSDAARAAVVPPARTSLYGAGPAAQLNGETQTNEAIPLLIADQVTAVDASFDQIRFTTTDGRLWQTRQASGGVALASDVASVSISSIAAGISAFHTLLVKRDGTLWASGDNFSGQLGDGTRNSRTIPAMVATDVVAAEAGWRSSIFLKADGTLWAMGANGSGQLGDGSTTDRYLPVQVATGVAKISAGGQHCLFIKNDGSLWAMGYNADGQLGDGTYKNRSVPVRIATGVKQMAAGYWGSFFITGDGRLWGIGHAIDFFPGKSYSPLPQVLADDVTASFLADKNAAFIKGDKSLWVAGDNTYAQLGDGTTVYRSAPQKLAEDVVSAAIGGRHIMFLCEDGSLWGAGSNSYGQLGIGLPPAQSYSAPVPVLSDAIDVANGRTHSLIVRADQTLWSFGLNGSGQLGDGTTTNRPAPIAVVGHVATVAAGDSFSYFIKEDGSLWGMGQNAAGQLGDGTTTARSAPVLIETGVLAAAAGASYGIFLKSDGTLWITGFGPLGSVSGLRSRQVTAGVAAFAAGASHVLLLKTDGSLWVAGDNTYGQLGDMFFSTTGSTSRLTDGVVAAAAGDNHSLFIKSDGTLWATGANARGQLGLADKVNRYAPVQIASGVKTVAAGYTRSLFIKTDGSLWSAGNGSSTPTQVSTNAEKASSAEAFYLVLRDGGPLNPPTLVAPIPSATIPFGGHHTFEPEVVGTQPMRYQWYSGPSGDTSHPIAWATKPYYAPQPYAPPASYWLRVSNAAGELDTDAPSLSSPGAGSAAYRAWAEAAGLSGSRLATTADSDGDGLPNLLEYALNLAPGEPSTRPTTATVVEDEGSRFLTLTYRRNNAAGLIYSYEFSTDLAVWSPVALDPVVVRSDVEGDGTTDEVSVACLLDPNQPTGFLRLRVSEP